MFSSVLSASIQGMEICPIQVEADLSDGLPSFSMVGYVSSQVKEAQERVRTAMKNTGLSLPPKRITVNLAPADIRKEGAGYDLPIAAAILSAAGRIPCESLQGILIIGEVSLSGKCNPVIGVLPVVRKARELGCHTCILPFENLQEGSMVPDIRVIGVRSLAQMRDVLLGKQKGERGKFHGDITKRQRYSADFREVQGQTVLY